ncbi:MAG: hypothetical protein LAT55_00160 [Opitutales bacterium]|nr:hypothetical protein [Opitutales bacterium]
MQDISAWSQSSCSITTSLFSQASRLVQSPLRPAYIIEGTAEDWKSLKIKRPALQGALISLMLVFDIPVLRSNDAEKTARLVVYEGQQLIRAQNDGWIPTRQIKAKRRSTRQRCVLQSLPGIGPGIARKIVDTVEEEQARYGDATSEETEFPPVPLM